MSTFFWPVYFRIRTEKGDSPVTLRIQSERVKIWIRETPNTDIFHAVLILLTSLISSQHFKQSKKKENFQSAEAALHTYSWKKVF